MMKKVIIYITAISIAFIFMSNSRGRAFTTGQGATTAPGESGLTCASIGCHSGSAFETEVQLEIRDEGGNLVDGYIPGQEYAVNINIGHIGIPAAYGFQIVSLRDSDDNGVNNFFNLPSLTQEVTIEQRQYIEHSSRLPVDNIDLNWTAPELGTGDVTFYVAGNAVNGNGNSSGDNADTTQITLVEEIMSNTETISNLNTINIYPNPTEDFVTIDSDLEIVEAHIVDVQGQVVKQINGATENIKDLSTGMYYIKAITSEGVISIKQLIKY